MLVLAERVSCLHGQDAVEYGLIRATIALAVLIGITAFGQQILDSIRAHATWPLLSCPRRVSY